MDADDERGETKPETTEDGSAPDVTVELPRILTELADGTIGDEEATTIADWLVAASEDKPPFWVVNRAVRIAGQSVGKDAPRPSAWRRLVAALVFDGRLERRVVGARCVVDEHRRLMCRASGVEIDLEIGPDPIAGRLWMLGQVTTSDPELSHGAWVIVDGPSGHLESEIGDRGQFSFDGLVPGVHRLEIGLSYELIEIPAVRF